MQLDEYPKVTLKVSNTYKEFLLLSELHSIKINSFNKIKDLKNNFEDLKQIVEFIEVDPRINYCFLWELKEKKIEYYDNGTKWDFNKNFDKL